ncbi:MAG: MotA/TolQ/ExbB proton channel family protein [Selenomonas ruminantium]|jgi:biopolymer transport protein ExbB|nr:MotA/TolQ/ExbB proton channel family protein [Selenomonas ruminantium]
MEYIVTGIEFFHKGGAVMYVLLLCSLLVVAIGVERALYYRQADSGREFARRFSQAAAAGHFEEAAGLAKNSAGVLAAVLLTAMRKATDAQAAHYMELQTGIELSRFRQRLYYLSVIVTMAPLLGLLGTISGMISSFSVFNVTAGQATAITGGVGEALIATAMGLCVAIAALTIHAYFTQRVENIVTDMELCCSLVEEHRAELLPAAAVVPAGGCVLEGGAL